MAHRGGVAVAAAVADRSCRFLWWTCGSGGDDDSNGFWRRPRGGGSGGGGGGCGGDGGGDGGGDIEADDDDGDDDTPGHGEETAMVTTNRQATPHSIRKRIHTKWTPPTARIR